MHTRTDTSALSVIDASISTVVVIEVRRGTILSHVLLDFGLYILLTEQITLHPTYVPEGVQIKVAKLSYDSFPKRGCME